ncbi:MAG TPA: EF-hand domain-containing protein [Gemmataceae bacterium]|nr:EF-hand domain-containing protein [Gemmataceae bacterium]
MPPHVQANQTRNLFRKLDVNGDGLLTPNEMPDALLNQRGRWDANRDGFIDLDEYGAYYQARLRSLSEQVASGQILLKPGLVPTVPNATLPDQEERRPTVYRAGRLPPGLPAWFVQLDTDGDAQVGLYEWKHSSRSLDDFRSIDRNGDGFITVEEVLHYQAQQTASRSNGLSRAGPASAGIAGNPGGFPKNSFKDIFGTPSEAKKKGGKP